MSKIRPKAGIPESVIAEVQEVLGQRFEQVKSTKGYAQLTAKGKEYLVSVFNSNPARFVGTNSLLSVTSLYPSKKLGLQIQTESDGCERVFALLSELDDDVLFLLDQPPKIHVQAHDKNGRAGPKSLTKDYIRFRTSAIDLIECKRESELIRLGETYFLDWVKDGDGAWNHIPSSNATAELGMQHVVFVADVISSATAHNAEVLLSLKDFRWSASCTTTARAVSRWLISEGSRSVLEISERYGKATGGLIINAIRKGILFSDFSHQLIDNEMLVFACKDSLEKYINGIHSTPAATRNERWARSSASEREGAIKAKEKYDKRRADGKPKNSTDYRYDSKRRAAKEQGFEEIFAFMPNNKGKGNRNDRLDPDLVEEIKVQVEMYYKEREGKHAASGFDAFVRAKDSFKERIPSLTTMRRIFNSSLAPEAAAFMEGGKRAFHATKPMTDGAQANLRPKIPGFLTHLDGVYGDRYSKEDERKLFLRPIYYPLIDDSTGYVFGRGVKVGHASSMPVWAAFRDTVRRHGGLPRRVMRDWGSELQSDAMRYFGGVSNVELASRPKSAPRFGARGESFNSSFTGFLQSNAGGTYFDKCGRSADADKKGRATATDNFSRLIRQSDDWIFETWNKTPIGKENLTPEQRNEQLMAAFPDALIKIELNDQFFYATSYPIDVRKIDYTRGLRFGTTRFSSSALTDLLKSGRRPSSPRLDCENPSIIWLDGPDGVFQVRSLDYKRDILKDAAARLGGVRQILTARRQSEVNQANRRLLEEKSRVEIAMSRNDGAPIQHNSSSTSGSPAKGQRSGGSVKKTSAMKSNSGEAGKTAFPRMDDPL